MRTRTLLTRRLEHFILNVDALAENLSGAIEQMANGSVSANLVLTIYEDMYSFINDATRLKTVPNITTFTRQQMLDPQYDFIAKADAFIGACQQVVDWIETNFPADANGWLQIMKIANGQVSTRAFSPQETEGLRGVLLNVISLRP